MRVLCTVLALFAATQATAISVQLTSGQSAKLRFSAKVSREETVHKIVKYGTTFTRIDRLEGFNPGQEGKPDVPRFLTYAAVDGNRRYQLTVKSSGETWYHDVLLYPVQKNEKEKGPKPPFQYDADSYEEDRWLGEALAAAGKPVKLGGVTLLPITFTPYQYNPRQRKLRIVSEIHVELEPVDGEAVFAKVLPSFVRFQLRELVVNAETVLKMQTSAVAQRAVIVTTQDLLGQANALAEMYAVNSIVVDYETISAGTMPEKIRGNLRQRYEKQPFDSILVLGDEKRVPLYLWDNITPGDNYYALLDGNDNLADVAIGRLPVSDAAQADTLIKRLRRYREIRESGYRNKKVLLVAHKEGFPGKYTYNSEELKNLDNPLGLTYSTQYAGFGANNASVIDKWKEGFSIVNYRGHGDETSWMDWTKDGKSFGDLQIRSLDLVDEKMPIVFNIACSTGAIQGPETMTERLFFPRKTGGGGAVGVIASTRPSYTSINDRFDIYLFTYLQKESDLTLGNLFTLANNRLVRDNNGELPENVKMYLLFSDPLLVPWIK